MNTHEVLERAADKIERDGWQGGWLTVVFPGVHRRNARCVHLTIDKVTDNGCVCRAALRTFSRAIGGTGETRYIWAWNDHFWRRKREVVAMLRAVASVEKARAARLLPVVRETVAA